MEIVPCGDGCVCSAGGLACDADVYVAAFFVVNAGGAGGAGIAADFWFF